MSKYVQALYTKPDVSKAELLIMKVTNYAWSEMTLSEQQELREQAAAELTAYRDLLTSIRETRHLGSFAIPAHVKAALELCEEQLAATQVKEGR
jgi:hypothetical protein